jgi:MoxR-like ATPase
LKEKTLQKEVKMSISQEQKILKERLEELEKGSNEKLFPAVARRKSVKKKKVKKVRKKPAKKPVKKVEEKKVQKKRRKRKKPVKKVIKKKIVKKPEKKPEEKKKEHQKTILDYLQKHRGKYELEDLKKKIISMGYSQEEIEKALAVLDAEEKKEPEKKPVKKVQKKKKKRRKREKPEKKPEKEEEKKPEKKVVKKDPVKTVLDYLQKHKKDYKLEDLKKKILSMGYSQEEIEKALTILDSEEKKKPEKKVEKKKPAKKPVKKAEKKKPKEKSSKEIISDYIKKYKDKYSLEDLRKKIVSVGYPEEEFEKALAALGLKEKKKVEEKPEKKVGKKEEKKAAAIGVRRKVRPGIKVGKPVKDNRPNLIEIKKCAEDIKKIKKEMGRVILGQEEVVEGLILGLLCNSHVLVEGVPGIAKTLAIRALAAASGCEVKRVQFTVDMLPTDITGLTTYTPEKGFEVIKGPIFANFIIGDEINRAPPKTQSALIEGMQEKQVTIGRERYPLPSPFFVMATENPIESAGVYPLPEAQIDRFLFKLLMGYPEEDTERRVMETNMTIKRFEDFKLKPVVNPNDIVRMQEIVKRVYLGESIKSYILAIVRKTRSKDFKNAEFISYGSSPRASIGLFIASKARALMLGRNYVLPEDVKHVVFKVLRHRLILTYKATIQKISPDDIVKEILNSVRV